MRFENRRLGTAQQGGSPPTALPRAVPGPHQGRQVSLGPQRRPLGPNQPTGAQALPPNSGHRAALPQQPVRGEALQIIQGASILILCAPLCHPILILQEAGAPAGLSARCLLPEGGAWPAPPPPALTLPQSRRPWKARSPRRGREMVAGSSWSWGKAWTRSLPRQVGLGPLRWGG